VAPEQTQDKIDQVRRVIGIRSGLVAAYLYGSTARGAVDPGDLDVAVMFEPEVDGFSEALALNVDLELATSRPADVHDFAALPVDIQFRVLCEGIVVVDNDTRTRVRREVAAQLAYYDFQPYLDRIRNASVERVVAGARRG
jgi:predicted nucleotidyltransferase